MKATLRIIIALLLIGTITLTYNIQQVNAPNGSDAYIYIKADGSIDPSDAPINTTDLINYRIISNIINRSIIVERDNITIQGFNHIVQGNASLRVGIDLTNRKNVTLDHIKITKFSYGVLLNSTQDCRLFYNTIWDNWAGIWTESCLRSIVNYNNASYNNNCGIKLLSGGNNELYYNTLCSNLQTGISAWYSVANTFVGNNASSNWSFGIHLYLSGAGNWLINNIADSNRDYGIYLYECDNNRLSGNNASNNRYNFGVDGEDPLDFIHTVDTTNHVNGKPIYYLRGEADMVLDETTNAGTVYLINCNNMTLRNLELTKNGHGILLWNTTESYIENVTASSNQYGMYSRNSHDNNVLNINFTENYYGILFKNSNNTIISKGKLAKNQWGIHTENSAFNNITKSAITDSGADGICFVNSFNNTLIANTIANNALDFEPLPMFYGVKLQNSEDNTIYHNNFVNNGMQAGIISANNNTWDNGYPSGGNYWSDYTEVDLDPDGLGDFPYEIEAPYNVDEYPLMGMFHWLETPMGHDVEIVCNSTVNKIHYYQSNTTIALTVSNTTSNQIHGFCRVTIPQDVIPPPYNVTVNGNPAQYIIIEENSRTTIYIGYEHSTVEIIIIPEFQSAMLMLLLASSTITTIALKKKRRPEI